MMNEVFERIRHTLECQDIVRDNDVVTITLLHTASEADLEILKKILFRGIHVSNGDSFFKREGKDIQFYARNYENFLKIVMVFESFGDVIIYDAEIRPFEISFEYNTKPNCPATFNYDQLGLIQKVIDPTVAEHHNIRVIGSTNEKTNRKTYTLRAYLR